MVLCDGGMTINLLAGAMMNGVCCLHSIQAEEDRHQRQKDELRRTINVEYERQRLFDKECRDRMKREEQLLQQIEEQKRRVMLEKQRVAANSDNGPLQMGSSSSSASRAVETFLGSAPRPINTTNETSSLGPHYEPIGLDASMRSRSSHCPRRALMARKLQLSGERNSTESRYCMSRSRTSPMSSPGSPTLGKTKKRYANISWYETTGNDEQHRVFSIGGSGKRAWTDDMTCVSQTSTQVSGHSLFDDADESDNEQ